MEDKKSPRRINFRIIAIIILSLIVLGEGAFLLLHRGGDAGSSGADAAAAGTSDAPQNGGTDGAGAQASDAPDADPDASADPAASDTPQNGGTESGSVQQPVPTPAVVIPPENKDKAYASAIGAVASCAKSPSVGTLAYVLGGELTGDQMQRFLPALLTMSGSSLELLEQEVNTDLDLPEGTTSLVITDERALSQDQINAAREKLQDMHISFSTMGELANEVRSYTDADWQEFGSQLNMSGPDAKKMFSDLTGSANAISSTLTGAEISEAYQVTLKSNTGDTMVTNVYCINGKWVTSAFFDMQFS